MLVALTEFMVVRYAAGLGVVAISASACGASAFVPDRIVDDAGAGESSLSFGEGGAACGTGADLTGCPCSDAGAGRACWTGPPEMRDVGTCHDGTQACVQDGEFATWGACTGERLDCGDAGGGADGASRQPPACGDPTVNTESGMIVAYVRSSGQPVGAAGNIVVWANDECPPSIAPGERVDPSTGVVKLPGNRAAKLHDGYLAEPALYVAPATAENGGAPFFPIAIRGGFNSSYSPYDLVACDCASGLVALAEAGISDLVAPDAGAGTLVPMDPPPQGTMLSCFWTAEYVWDVPSLQLAPGAHDVELSIPDGDGDREELCITVVVE